MEVIRKIDIKTKSRINFNDLVPLLKEGKLQEFIYQKEKRIKEWKEERYRICVCCGKQKLRTMFDGDSKYCKYCKSHKKKESKKLRKEYFKDYIRTDGKENWCAKQIVYNMKKMGILEQKPCEVCNDKNSFAHHCDYNKPWEVMWLCRKHHNEWHKNNKPKYVK